MKNLPKKVTIGTSIKRKTKKGNSTLKTSKTRCTPRFYEVKIRFTADDFVRGQPYFQERKYLPRFILDAYREKVNRSESYDKAGRLRVLTNNMDMLEPVLKEMGLRGKLDFLKKLFGN